MEVNTNMNICWSLDKHMTLWRTTYNTITMERPFESVYKEKGIYSRFQNSFSSYCACMHAEIKQNTTK